LKCHSINFGHIYILNKVTGYMDYMIKEVIKIRLHPRNIKRDGGFTLSQPWYLVVNLLKDFNDPPIQRQGHAKQAFDTAHKPPIGSCWDLKTSLG
jgi:hypothetical protein